MNGTDPAGTAAAGADATGMDTAGTDALSRLQGAGRHALELEAVSRYFGALVALADINFTLGAGERRAVLGSNGAGKTTLFNAICGDFPPTTGRVRLFGEDVTDLPVHERIRRGLRRTYQISLLFGGLRVIDGIYLACRGVSRRRFSLRRARRDDAAMQAAETLAGAVNLDAVRSDLVSTLSHGQQRQLEIVLALASDPKVLLLDEPSAGLATGESREMANFLKSLDPGIAILLIEHDLDVIFEVVSRISVLHYGEVLAEGPSEEIRSDPRVQEIYLGKAE